MADNLPNNNPVSKEKNLEWVFVSISEKLKEFLDNENKDADKEFDYEKEMKGLLSQISSKMTGTSSNPVSNNLPDPDKSPSDQKNVKFVGPKNDPMWDSLTGTLEKLVEQFKKQQTTNPPVPVVNPPLPNNSNTGSPPPQPPNPNIPPLPNNVGNSSSTVSAGPGGGPPSRPPPPPPNNFYPPPPPPGPPPGGWQGIPPIPPFGPHPSKAGPLAGFGMHMAGLPSGLNQTQLGGLGILQTIIQNLSQGLNNFLMSNKPGNNISGVGQMTMGLGAMTANPMMISIGFFGKALGDAIEKLKNWGDALHQSNMQFSEFSAGMAKVAADQQRRDILLSKERGDRLAPSAAGMAETMHEFNKQYARSADFFGEFKNVLYQQIMPTMTSILKGINDLVGAEDYGNREQIENLNDFFGKRRMGSSDPNIPDGGTSGYGRPPRFPGAGFGGAP